MKAQAKRVLQSLYRFLPRGVQEALFAGYCQARSEHRVFLSLATRLNVDSLTVRGIEGSIHDQVILPTYGRTGQWAQRTVTILQDFFAQYGCGTYLDIGANIGLTTIPIARNPKVECHAFEPDPETYRFLTGNLSRNGEFLNVSTYPYALSDTDGELTLERNPDNGGDHRVRLNDAVSQLGESSWATVPIQARRLDDLKLTITKPLAVKIDVQGAEPLVLAGGWQTLSHAQLVLLEYSPYWMQRMGTDPKGILSFMQQFRDVALAAGETGTIEPWKAMDASEYLWAQTQKARPDQYWDVLLRGRVR